MSLNTAQYRGTRPIKIAILGASGVGKTSVALQYITKSSDLTTTPTTIEDVYRKDINICVTDELMIQNIQRDTTNDESNQKRLLERSCNGNDESCDPSAVAEIDLSLSLKIIDTSGYMEKPKIEQEHRTSFFSRLTLRQRHHNHNRNAKSIKKTNECKRQLSTKVRTSTFGSYRVKDRHATSMEDSDGLILVYSVLDDQSFEVAKLIRNRFVEIHSKSSTTSEQTPKKSYRGFFSNLLKTFCIKEEETTEESPIPPIYLIGTHSDVRVEKMVNEKSSRLYDVSFLRSNSTSDEPDSRKKQKLTKSMTVGRTSVYPHDVYPVISEWKECSGFAEITSHDTELIEQIFEKLNLAIVASQE